MGNVVSNSTTGELVQGPVSDWISKWALNNYTVSDSNNTTLYKNTLKKRSCCTNQQKIPIAIADATNNAISNIAVLIDTGPINDSSCNNLSTSTQPTGGKYLFNSNTNNNVVANNNSCGIFYQNFAADLLEQRKINYSKINDQLYGPLPDKNSVSNTNVYNAYTDCNCQNSIFQVYQTDFRNANGQPDPQSLAQNIDIRCDSNLSKTFKEENKTSGSPQCFNIVNISNSQISNAGLTQSCTQTVNNNTIVAPNSTPASSVATVKPTSTPVTSITPTPISTITPVSSTIKTTSTSTPTITPIVNTTTTTTPNINTTTTNVASAIKTSTATPNINIPTVTVASVNKIPIANVTPVNKIPIANVASVNKIPSSTVATSSSSDSSSIYIIICVILCCFLMIGGGVIAFILLQKK